MRRLRFSPDGSRHGVVIPLAAVLLTMVFAFAALTVDVGYITVTKAQLQRCADAAALDAANRLRDDRRAASVGLALEVADEARRSAGLTAAANPCAGVAPDLIAADVTIGRLLPDGAIDTSGDPRLYNAARVRVRRDGRANGPLQLFFAPLLGVDTADLSAEATAALEVTNRGFRPTRQPSTLIPFAVHEDVWEEALDGGGRDDFAWDPDAERVRHGADGAAELDIFTKSQHASGNFGTLRIGRSNNGMGPLLRQIDNGVGSRDLREYGGQLDLGDDGFIEIPGDPGLGGPIYAAAAGIIGKPVSIAIYSDVDGKGGNARYRVVGFAGIRIVSVRGNGSDKSGSDKSGSDKSGSGKSGSGKSGSGKSGSDEDGSDEDGSDEDGSDEDGSDEDGSDTFIRVQPALVRDETAIPGEAGQGRYIYGAARLVQ